MIISKTTESRIKSLIAQNRKMEAIKLVFDETKCGLKEAKDFIDNFQYGRSGSAAVSIPEETSGINSYIQADLFALLAKGKKLEAIKLCRDHSNMSLAESKSYVENLQRRGAVAGSAINPEQQPMRSDSVSWENNSSNSGSNPISRSRETQLDDIIKQQGLKTRSGCFIATACYGNYDAVEVVVLRQFRDQRLMNSLAGRLFVKFYYAVSPPIARKLEKSEKLKKMVRVYLLAPLVNRFSKAEANRF